MKFLRVILLVGLGLGSAVSGLRAELVNGVKAVVHTSVITYGEVESDVLLLVDEYKRLYGRQPEVFNQKIATALQESLDRALEHRLILHDFEKAGYQLPESVIEDVVQRELRATYRDRATLTKTLQARGVTYEKWRQQVRDRFLVTQMRLKNVYSETIISPAKIQDYYEANRTNYLREEQVKLRMITLNATGPDELEAARSLAREIRTKITGGAAFSEMASIYSQGTQRANGGDWGWASRDVLRAELAEAAFALKPGEMSEVIETPGAVFLMLVEERRAGGARPIAEVRDEIEETLLKQERERLQKSYVQKLRAKTFVRQFDF
jgi:peptidyl-prolyl cis-trans isomerase SurA